MLIEKNGWETWQSSLLYVFVYFFEGRPHKKPGKIQTVITCAYTTHQKKHCDYVIHA